MSVMHFEIYPQNSGERTSLLMGEQWRWRLKAANNKIIATSGESYWNKQDCLHAIDLVVGASSSTPINEVLS